MLVGEGRGSFREVRTLVSVSARTILVLIPSFSGIDPKRTLDGLATLRIREEALTERAL